MDREADHGTIMPVNAKITPRRPAQFSNPLSGCRVSLDELHFTSTLTVREPRSIIRGNVLRVKRIGLHMLLLSQASVFGGAMNSYQWAALYQQRPSPLGGGIFKCDDWQFYKQPP